MGYRLGWRGDVGRVDSGGHSNEELSAQIAMRVGVS